MSVNVSEVCKIAGLAKLNFDDVSAAKMAEGLGHILAVIKTMSEVDTSGVSATFHSIEEQSPMAMREDVVTEENHRADLQSIGPEIAEGLYSVPKVIE